MRKAILQELPELIEAGVISEAVAQKIEDYYHNHQEDTSNRIFIIFGILGALLVGLGIILIIAHNWDNLTRTTKSIIAFAPLLIGQIACGYTLLRKKDNRGWIEASATFLTLAIGASIALVSQIYHIPGDIGSFMLTWSLLTLPLVYIMNASMPSLLYIIGITIYASSLVYNYPFKESYWFWGLLLLVIPHFYQLIQNKPLGNFTILHHLFIPVAISIMLMSIVIDHGHLIMLAYICLFGIFYWIGKTKHMQRHKSYFNFYQIAGSVGSLILLLVLSFRWYWEEWAIEDIIWSEVLTSPEFLVATLLAVLGGYLLLQTLKQKSFQDTPSIKWAFLVIFLLFFIGKYVPILATILVNILIFFTGIQLVRRGTSENHLGILNYGLFIITALIICRFFDIEMSFVARGIIFVLVGIGFFLVNYRMIQKRKSLN